MTYIALAADLEAVREALAALFRIIIRFLSVIKMLLIGTQIIMKNSNVTENKLKLKLKLKLSKEQG